MKESIKLNPCPFCNGNNLQPFENMHPGRSGIVIYFVICNSCGAEGPCMNNDRDLTPEESIEAWNNRATK